MKHSVSKCASCAGGIGICLCTIFMSLSIIGASAVGLSKNANSGNSMQDMGSMTAATNSAASLPSVQSIMVGFFSGFWGEVILLISFGLMLIGMWFTRRSKVILISMAGIILLYISMYVYYFVSLEIAGVVILAVAYASAYNYRIAKTIKLA